MIREFTSWLAPRHDLTIGESIVAGAWRTGLDNTCVLVRYSSGGSDLALRNRFQVNIQIMVRAFEFIEAHELVWEIWNDIHQIGGFDLDVVTSGVSYFVHMIEGALTPQFLGHDPQNRQELTATFTVRAERAE